MKKSQLEAMNRIIVFAAFLALFMDTSAQSFQRGDFLVSAGAGVSSISLLLNTLDFENVNSRPVINVLADFGIARKFSIGGGVALQTASAQATVDGQTATGKVRCANFGLRGLYHFGQQRLDFIDLYAGARVSYVQWLVSGNLENIIPLGGFGFPAFGFQPLAGANVLVARRVGIQAELSPIGVYLAQVSIVARIGK